MQKKILDKLSLKKLKNLAKKYKISCFKKNTKICVKKSTLLKRLKKSKSIKKILETAQKLKNKKNKFGKNQLPANYPRLSTPLEIATGQTYNNLLRHYNKLPTTLISTNMQGPSSQANGGIKKVNGNNPINFRYNVGSLGRSSLPPYKNINNFGQYFH